MRPIMLNNYLLLQEPPDYCQPGLRNFDAVTLPPDGVAGLRVPADHLAVVRELPGQYVHLALQLRHLLGLPLELPVLLLPFLPGPVMDRPNRGGSPPAGVGGR